MKEPGHETEMQVPLINGIPATAIIKLLADGHDYQQICRRCPGLDWPHILEAVHFRNHTLVTARLAEGKTPKEIAREFGFSPANVWAIKCAVAKDKELREQWGGLSARTVTLIKRYLHCRSLSELFQKYPAAPTEEHFLTYKGIGIITVKELIKVLPLKDSDSRPAKENCAL